MASAHASIACQSCDATERDLADTTVCDGLIELVSYQRLRNSPQGELMRLLSDAGLRLSPEGNEFIEQSRARHDDDAYSMFRGVHAHWQPEHLRPSVPILLRRKTGKTRTMDTEKPLVFRSLAPCPRCPGTGSRP